MYPLISILIPAYNYAPYVVRAIESALGQSYPNIEVVVSDNASTDDSVDRIRARFGDDPRVRLFVNESNIGMVPNFNLALERARGEFVVWLCADDFLYPHHSLTLYECFQRMPQIDVAYSVILFCDDRERIISEKTQDNIFPVDYVDARDELPAMLLDHNQVSLPTALFRRELFAELGGMDPVWQIGADWELLVRIAINGKRFAFRCTPTCCCRVHDANASGKEFNLSGASFVETVAIIEKFVDHPGMARMRGREDGIVRRLDSMREGHLQAAFSEDFERRFAALRTTLLERASNYRPATVRGHTVSIVMPYASTPSALMDAVDSVAAQTYPQWELVVVDSGRISVSPPLDAHPAADRIRKVRLRPLRPPGAARNFALEMVRGEYVTFLDEDNIMAPDHIASLVDTLDASSAEIAAASARLVIDLADKALAHFERVGVVEGLFRGPDDPDELGAVANALPLNALLHHRRLFDLAGPFNAGALLLEDFDYVGRATNVGRLVFSGRATLDIHIRLGLRGQALGLYGESYPEVLASVYEARTVGPAIDALRARQLAAVRAAVAQFATLPNTPEGVVSLLLTLAGREIFAPAIVAG